LYLFNGCVSVFGALRTPAYQAAVSSIVNNAQYTKAVGWMGLSKNAAALSGPLLAGTLMGIAGLEIILVFNLLASFLGAVLILHAFRDVQKQSAESTRTARGLMRGVVRNMMLGIAFFRTEPLMLGLLGYVIVQGALLSLASLMVTPLVLASHSEQQLGVIYVCASLGGLAGVGLLVVGPDPSRLMPLLLLADAVLSLAVLMIGLVDSTFLYCLFGFLAITTASMAEGCCNVLWLRKIPSARRASVLALIGMVSTITMTAVIYGGGVLADRFLEPALMPGGALASSLGSVLGLGKGRGIALLFIGSGGVGLTLCVATLLYPRMRRIDLLVSDAVV
jgi:diaminobutyrate-2-oxoglutarate transaminase